MKILKDTEIYKRNDKERKERVNNSKGIEYKVIAMPVLVGVDEDDHIIEVGELDKESINGKNHTEVGVEINMYSADSINYKKWLKYSEDDLASAGVNYNEGYYKQSSVLAYQAFEKGLKAYLVFVNSYAPNTHNLQDLVRLCVERNKEFEYYEGVEELYRGYYINSRYPKHKQPDYSDYKVMTLMQEAAKLCGFVEEQIENSLR